MLYLPLVKKENSSLCKCILFKAELSGARPIRTAKWDINLPFPPGHPPRPLKDGRRVHLASRGNLVNVPWWQAAKVLRFGLPAVSIALAPQLVCFLISLHTGANWG